MEYHISQSALLTKTISENDVQQFAWITGDNNPIHLDELYAQKTRFGRRIVHGMLGASLISAVIGTQLPGDGTIYLNQSLQFTAPMYIGDTITTQVTITNIREDKPLITLETICTNQHDTIVIQGEALVLNEKAMK
ncbi:MAG: MaoC family dehydratase [Planctomycetes bacterium]|nr:MaoC family dehydratase [Planctomycetota bacterium]